MHGLNKRGRHTRRTEGSPWHSSRSPPFMQLTLRHILAWSNRPTYSYREVFSVYKVSIVYDVLIFIFSSLFAEIMINRVKLYCREDDLSCTLNLIFVSHQQRFARDVAEASRQATKRTRIAQVLCRPSRTSIKARGMDDIYACIERTTAATTHSTYHQRCKMTIIFFKLVSWSQADEILRTARRISKWLPDLCGNWKTIWIYGL